MIENRENDWQELEFKAMQMLENPRLLPKDETTKHFIPTLHLWISPTFTPDKHWVFYKTEAQINPSPKPFVRQITWEKETDLERITNPLNNFQIEPTFQFKTIEIERKTFENFHHQLAEIQLSPFIQEEMNGRDGKIFGVETLDSFYSAKIFWWSDYPPEWKNLVDWFQKVKECLEEKFNDR